MCTSMYTYLFWLKPFSKRNFAAVFHPPRLRRVALRWFIDGFWASPSSSGSSPTSGPLSAATTSAGRTLWAPDASHLSVVDPCCRLKAGGWGECHGGRGCSCWARWTFSSFGYTRPSPCQQWDCERARTCYARWTFSSFGRTCKSRVRLRTGDRQASYGNLWWPFQKESIAGGSKFDRGGGFSVNRLLLLCCFQEGGGWQWWPVGWDSVVWRNADSLWHNYVHFGIPHAGSAHESTHFACCVLVFRDSALPRYDARNFWACC